MFTALIMLYTVMPGKQQTKKVRDGVESKETKREKGQDEVG